MNLGSLHLPGRPLMIMVSLIAVLGASGLVMPTASSAEKDPAAAGARTTLDVSDASGRVSRSLSADKDVVASAPAVHPDDVPADSRTAVLGKGWQQSGDVSWMTSGDANGFHLLTARAASGYAWQTVTTLSEPGFEADSWIGNACVTASGRRAVVTYAPRTFTNEASLFERGGMTAVVDLLNGTVRKLPYLSTLAYFSPACGAAEESVITQAGTEDLGRTRLLRVDAVGGKVVQKVEVPGQLTSAVPTRAGIVAADSNAVVRVQANGSRRVIAGTNGVPFRLAADADGGVVFLDKSGKDRAVARRVQVPTASTFSVLPRVTKVAEGLLTGLDVTSGRGGQVYVTGAGTAGGALPGSVKRLAVKAGSRVSTRGQLAITSQDRSAPAPAAASAAKSDVDGASPMPVTVTATVLATGRPLAFTTVPGRTALDSVAGLDTGRSHSLALGPGSKTKKTAAIRANAEVQAAGSPTGPADLAERYCSVPRNDPANQAMQPKPRQVEWAIDQAVRGSLTVSRPAGWKNLGMPAYTPQGLFPRVGLAGSTGYVPAQVMLGVVAQESNLWEAARFAVPGVTANPLIGNYYGNNIYNGTESDDWSIKWSDADCGYGVTQMTDGMRLAGHEKPGETALPYQTQRAVGLDFAANVAAGLRLLETKWNQTRAVGLTINNGDPSKLENWFYAVWAYNSGLHPQSEASQHNGAWGLGWLNNPANPNYPANRAPFLEGSAADASHPQDWPYPEKVMGFAAYPPWLIETPGTLVAAFRGAWWAGGTDDMQPSSANNRRRAVKPPVNQFCTTANWCTPGAKIQPTEPDVINEPAGPCAHTNSSGQYDLECWVSTASTWKSDCADSCGHELLRFDPGYAYQDDATSYPPRCTLTGLPSTAQVVDDVPDGTLSIRPNCGRPWTNQGTFNLTYKADTGGQYPGKMDTHQIGGGFGGHFWFAHTRAPADNGGKLAVTGTWQASASRNGPMQVLVALPDLGAQARVAKYVISTVNGDRTRIINQYGNGIRWLSLGAFMFNGVPKVTLSNETPNGDGSDDIAFDAVAFVPLTGTYKEESVEAVTILDENTNVDVSNWSAPVSGVLQDRQHLYDWAMSNTGDILALTPCPDPGVVGDCLSPLIKTFAQNWRARVQAAGTDPVQHPAGQSIPLWMGFATPGTNRPTSLTKPASFDNMNVVKSRVKATVSFLVANGVIVSGSEWVQYDQSSGNTTLAPFVREFITAVSSQYGIASPTLKYTARDLNAHDGGYTSVDLMASGKMPSRAFAMSGKAPKLLDSSGAVTVANGTCVSALVNGGAVDGYRPMLSQDGPDNGYHQWVDRLEASGFVTEKIIDLAKDIGDTFFEGGLVPAPVNSAFNAAPPIWQELKFKACLDGTIKQDGAAPVLRTAWMADQYLYHNNKAITLTGADATSAAPVFVGDFQTFSSAPVPFGNHAYGHCDGVSGHNGNSWGIGALDSAGANPTWGHFCTDRDLAVDSEFSSGG